MAPPASSETIDIHLNAPTYEAAIRRLCTELLIGWATAGEISLQQITGGITNVLYKASSELPTTMSYRCDIVVSFTSELPRISCFPDSCIELGSRRYQAFSVAYSHRDVCTLPFEPDRTAPPASRPCLQAWVVVPGTGVPDPAVIVRVFGDKSEMFIDRDRDLRARAAACLAHPPQARASLPAELAS